MNTKQKILEIIEQADSIIPDKMLPDMPINDLTDKPGMRSFEYEIWSLGDKIRPLLTREPRLRSDKEVQKGILNICLNKNAKRGRESFVMLMGSVKFSKLAPKVASLIDDPYVFGHAIDTLLKMKQQGYYKNIKPFTESKVTWIRNKAKKYCETYSGL